MLKPQLPIVDVYGNLTFLVTRPDGNNQKLSTAPSLCADVLEHSNHEVWQIPETIDLAARCLIDCANRLRSEQGPRWEKLRRIVQNRNHPEDNNHDLFLRKTHENFREKSGAIKQGLSEEQQAAIKHIEESKQLITLIQGASGTGKTTVATAIVRLFHARDIKVGCFAPSNLVVGILARKLEDQAPDIEAIRFDPISGPNTKETCHQLSKNMQSSPKAKSQTSGPRLGDTHNDALLELTSEQLKEQEVWFQLETDIIRENGDWVLPKVRRHNHGTMGLEFRTLQAAGILTKGKKIPAVRPPTLPVVYEALLDAFYDINATNDYPQSPELLRQQPQIAQRRSNSESPSMVKTPGLPSFGSKILKAFQTTLRDARVVLTT